MREVALARIARGNWLERVDAKVFGLTPASNWRDLPRFLLIRYPHLRPVKPATRGEHRSFEKDQQAFYKEIAKYEAKIANSGISSQVTNGLNAEQRKQLAALLADAIEAFQVYTLDWHYHRIVRQITKQKASGKVSRKISKIRKALQGLRDCTLDPTLSTHVENVLALFDSPLSLSRTWEDRLRDPKYINPSRFNMVRLYWFFRHACKLHSDESEVRTGLIHNTFFVLWAKTVDVVCQYDGTDRWKGCPAVRMAARRRL